MNQKRLRARNQYAMVRAEVWWNRRRFQDHEVRITRLERELGQKLARQFKSDF